MRFPRLDSPERKLAAVVVVVVILGAVVALILGRGDADPIADTGSASPRPSLEATSSGEAPQVPPIDACQLLTDPEVEQAMGIAGLPVEDRALSTTSGGEQCRWTNSRPTGQVEGLSVQVGPGSPSDFGDGASLEGVVAQPVLGVGELASWFSFDTHGIISAVDDSSFGYVFARLLIERQDLDDAGRLEVAKQAMATALLRFPGMEVPEFAIPVTIIDPAPPDRAGYGLVENLIAREESGEWTLGEGLVATLELLAGEADADDVLRETDIPFLEGTGVLKLADEYLAAGSDAEAEDEIRALLSRLVFSSEQLNGMAGLDGTVLGSRATSVVALGGTLAVASPPTVSEPMVADAAEDCTQFFYGFDAVLGVGPCLLWYSDHLGDLSPEEFRIFVPAPGYPQGGWTDRHYQLAAAAIVRTADIYEEMGDLPQINVVFAVIPDGKSLASATNQGGGKPCGIFLDPSMQSISSGAFQQTVAHEMGHCFTAHNYTPQSRLSFKVIGWWEEGIAEFLSNLAYPSVNDEWQWRARLATIERRTGITYRAYDNYTFFQFIAGAGESEKEHEVLRLLQSLPGCGQPRVEITDDALDDCWAESGTRQDQASGLSAYFRLSERILEFQERMTDASIVDTGGLRQPFDPQADEVRTTGRTVVRMDAFEMGRLHVMVPPGDYACLEYGLSGGARASWRTGRPGGPQSGHNWDEELPEWVSGEAVFVTTTMEDESSFTLEVTRLVDNGADCVETSDPGGGLADCLSLLCGPSNYFRAPGQIEDWMQEVLPDLPL